MEYNILENGWYQLPFEIERDGDIYRDALVVSPEEYAALTPNIFEKIKLARFFQWQEQIKYMTANPSTPPSDPLADKRRIHG